MQPPPDPPAPAQRWVSFDEARMILRMSEGTLRREIKAGRVIGEKRRRNPDSPTDLREVYEVLVTDPPAAATPSESVQAPDTRHDAPALAEKLLETVLTQAETIADLRERAGRAEERAIAADRRADRAERERAEERGIANDLAADLARIRAEQAKPWWRKALGLPPA